MAINRDEAYKRLEDLVVNETCKLRNENERLRSDLAIANAKLSVYERIASISDSKNVIGFGPPNNTENY